MSSNRKFEAGAVYVMFFGILIIPSARDVEAEVTTPYGEYSRYRATVRALMEAGF